MNTMITELYDAPISAGAEELRARDAARVLVETDLGHRDKFGALREDNQAMRTEMAALNGSLREDVQKLRTELKSEMAGLRTELTTIKWMFGVMVGVSVAIAFRVFTV